jgi:hypothetical protein
LRVRWRLGYGLWFNVGGRYGGCHRRWGWRRWRRCCRRRFRLLGLPPSGQAQLRRAGDADGENQERPGEGCPKQGDGHGHLAIGPEELDPHGPGVLHDEIDQGHTQHSCHGHGHPYPADPGPVDTVPVRASSTRGAPLRTGYVLDALVSGIGLHLG